MHFMQFTKVNFPKHQILINNIYYFIVIKVAQLVKFRMKLFIVNNVKLIIS